MAGIMHRYRKWVIPEKIHTPDGWHDFLTPLPPRFPGPLDPPSCPDFQVQRPPLPPRFPLISLEALILIESRWKTRKITFRRFFLLFLKTLVNIFAKLISIINKCERVTFERACSSLNATCLFSTPHQIHKIRKFKRLCTNFSNKKFERRFE